MSLITKLGIIILGFGLAANITGNRLAEHYNNQKNNAAVVLENTILKTNSIGMELDRAIGDFEKYEGRRNYANGVRDLSYIIILLGGALALGRRKIRINLDIV
jgi:hypothetical protein